MKGQISFSAIGNELIHELRDRLNNSEDITDVRNNFSYTVISLLSQAFENIEIDADDVNFTPEKENRYSISDRLMNIKEFKEIWQHSDLSNVINKFADSSYHRYLHTNKHQEKTNKKIRNP